MLICSGQFVMTQWRGSKFLWLAIKQILLHCRHINIWQLNGVLRPIKISCFNKYVGWEIYTRQTADYWISSLHIWELYAQSHLLHLPLRSLYPTQCKEELPIFPSMFIPTSLWCFNPIDFTSLKYFGVIGIEASIVL